jgi:hypothetical protein
MNRVTSLIALLLAGALGSSPVAASNLVAAWGFGEKTGRVAFDSSGNHVDGTISGATRWLSARGGQVLALDGVDDYVLIGNPEPVNVSRYTIMAWIRPFSRGVSDPLRMEVLEKEGSYWMNVRRDTGRLRCGSKFGPPSTATQVTIDSLEPIPLKVWSHVACSYNGGQLKMHVNGKFVKSANVPADLQINNLPLSLGNKTFGSGLREAHWHGLLDDVKIFNVALSLGDIVIEKNTPVFPR